ncbi:MAG: catechol 2,3-dioxygenase [Rhodospirillaceae bacterium]|jgi:catechol 2,3-dioxygenase|nr:catechol 2,3-dioxygenase [Rhodospirillaceae bacterium]MBT5192370.1 catechol 2,3-dioxygenase [Rhodospirillaceae bacterium]MBT5898418.1 catechol 2,3-dioxygenase [Rhodospirillaceae bacterium]MBT6429054.1 catechol 2,3-dioxygenase [Rhodospirillaceae bacterium]MBT7760712.1 catechol 2,3-dioxygenase [Rhodospirillaceae bacterium]
MEDRDEPLQDIAHLGHVELLTPKPEESLWYFTEFLGLECVHEEGRSVYLRGYGDYAATTFKLTEATAPGIGHVAWRAVSKAALERRAKAIEDTGLGLGWSNGDFGHGRSYRFRDPDGHLMEVYYDEERYVAPAELRSSLKNQPMRFTGRGAGVRRLDHLALLSKEVGPNRAFAEKNLGLRVREQVIFEDGGFEVGSWMSTTAVHHELAYVADLKGANGRLHHVSFWIDNREDVLRAADILTENGVFIETGPAKHNNSQAFYLYSYEPGGNRIEIYSGGYLVFAPDFEPVIWNEAERGTGVYWGGALPDSFLNYATPDIAAAGETSIPDIDPL